MKSWIEKNWFYIALILSIVAFWLFKSFLNENSPAIMVLITAVYVIATINISIANNKSAEATRNQIIESKHQFEETQRLQVMPYLQLTFIDSDINDAAPCVYIEMRNHKEDAIPAQAYFTLKNIGLGIAHHTKITVTTRYKEDDEYPAYDIVMPPNCEKSTYVRFNVAKYEGKLGRREDISVHIKFEDILGNTYAQTAQLLMVVQTDRASLFHAINMSSPQLEPKSKEMPNA